MTKVGRRKKKGQQSRRPRDEVAFFLAEQNKRGGSIYTFGEEEIAELLLKIKTRQETQVIKALVHLKAMIMPFTLLLFRFVLPNLLRRLGNLMRERYRASFVLSGNTFSSRNDFAS